MPLSRLKLQWWLRQRVMDHEQAFLKAVCERPEDDTPRLVFADWLDEHGDDARAEFIRAQCWLARMAESDPGRAALQSRTDALLNAHREDWIRPLYHLVTGLRGDDVRFSRGFPSSITLRSVEALAQAERLLEIAPIQEVRLELVGNDINAEGVRALFNSPSLKRLSHLHLGVDLGAEGAQALAESPHLRQLAHLTIPLNIVGDAGASALAGSSRLSSLTDLDLRFNEITDEGARALARSAGLSNLTHLDLSFNRIGEEGARSLLDSIRSGSLSNLTSLELNGNRIGRNLLREIRRATACHAGRDYGGG